MSCMLSETCYSKLVKVQLVIGVANNRNAVKFTIRTESSKEEQEPVHFIFIALIMTTKNRADGFHILRNTIMQLLAPELECLAAGWLALLAETVG